MSTECGNDCTTPIDFPRRPANRPGLAHIDYRIGAYADFRAAMLRGLDQADNLQSWTYRGSDDPGIALLEGAAILGDILTFYQETYANEAFLRTAQWRESIADLVRLLGYRLSPGLGGRASFAFEVKEIAVPKGASAPSPAAQGVTVPDGYPLKAQLEGIPKQVDFETESRMVAYPWLNRFSLFRPLQQGSIGASTVELYIATPDQYVPTVTLKAGDRLLIGDADSQSSPTKLSSPEIVIVDSVRTSHGVQIFRIKGALKRSSAVSSIVAYKLGRTFRHLGQSSAQKVTPVPSSVSASSSSSTNSASPPVTTTNTSVTLPAEKDVLFLRDVSSYITGGTRIEYPLGQEKRIMLSRSLMATEYPLDGDVSDLANGSRLLFQGVITPSNGSAASEQTYVRKIVSMTSDSVTWGTVTGKSTVVTLDAALSPLVSGAANYLDIRQLQIHEAVSPALVLKAAPQESAATSGNDLYFYGTDVQAQSLLVRRVMLAGVGDEPAIATITAVETLDTSVADRLLLRRVTLDSEVSYADFSNRTPTVTVFGNVADATQGKTEAEAALGNGDARQIFQTFKLPKAPLTYLVAAGETPPEAPELEIRVGGKLWSRVDTFFGHAYDEEIYIVREDADEQSWVQFGDGKTGARLPSGVKNVTARYRTGTGAFGPLKAGATVQPGARLDRLDKIQMPGLATGGSDPEDGDNARDAAPGTFQSLDRLVTLSDFESEALAISGVARSQAAWRIVDGAPAVALTVLMKTGRGGEIESVRGVIASYNRCRGPQRHRVVVVEGLLRFVLAGVTVAVDPRLRREDVEAAIIDALGVNEGASDAGRSNGMFSMRVRRFGEAEYGPSIEGAIQRVEGVLWARITSFMSLGTAYDPATIALPAAQTLETSVTCGPSEMLSLYHGHLTITYAAVAAGEGC